MKGIYAQKTLSEIDESGTSEHDLWIAVLSKAAHDAIYSFRLERVSFRLFLGLKQGDLILEPCVSMPVVNLNMCTEQWNFLSKEEKPICQ